MTLEPGIHDAVTAADYHDGGDTPTEPYYCETCGRRFFNLGWHAEACGSPDYHRLEKP